jgi:hypothetical protein
MRDKQMTTLTNPRWIKAKGLLFLLLGTLAAALILIEHPDWRIGLLLAIAIWSFCRFYDFAFYVIENYVDPSYRFAGLSSFFRYLLTRRHNDRREPS